MADNTTLNAGTGGDVIATDDIAGVKHQQVKIEFGADGVATSVSATDPLPVDVISALPAGTNAIGKLAANSGVDIGDVDVTSVIPGTGATNLGKAEDAAHTSGDVGVMALGVRQDGRAPMAGTSGDYMPLSLNSEGELRVQTFGSGTIDAFGSLITGSVNNAVDVQFYRNTPANLTTVTLAGTGTANASGGMATFTTGASAGGSAKGVSLTSMVYTGGAEVYALFTGAFTGTGGTSTFQRIGLYDTNNGFFIGFEGTTFGVTVRTGASDTQTPKASFNLDTLTGAATSGFTRAGVPEAIDLTKLNVWRIRFGWVGSAPVIFEVLSPDDHWVPFHIIRQPNLVAVPHIQNADLPITCNVSNAAVTTTLAVLTNCWVAGTTQRLSKLNATLTDNSLAGLERAVITGVTTGGGGGYVNVKVTPSGALVADVSGTVTANLAAGTNNIGDVDILSIAAGTNTIGDVGLKPRTSGGMTTYHLVSAATTNATVVKNSAGQLFGWYIYNSNAAARKVAFHNASSTPTAGASVFFSLVIPPTSGANVMTDMGIAFSTGIAITTVTELTDAGNTAVAANDLIINLFYA